MRLAQEIKKTAFELDSIHLKRTVALEIYMPLGISSEQQFNLLLLNDGQDADALQLQATLENLLGLQQIEALAVVAIRAGDERIQEYGVAGMPDYLGRGAKAGYYEQFIINELLPFVAQHLPLKVNGKTGFAGFSLGGLSAFDIVYRNPEHFNLGGVFSGAFWWRSKALDAAYDEEQHRIVLQMIRGVQSKPAVKFWLMAGTADETSDRNNNGIIDSIDDTIDVIKALLHKGFQRPADLCYYEALGGKHDVPTWGKAFPAFLRWAFPRQFQRGTS
ncbi:alpha/beta hydrolase [Pedobacter sp.]|uniref:alpha/beta hydrolase n=1 Tax=Pedobacter sp. TaxID=1411316 RepID=UPI003D7F1D5C